MRFRKKLEHLIIVNGGSITVETMTAKISVEKRQKSKSQL